MNKTLIKKALACMLALTMAAVSSGCGSKDDKSSSKVDTSSEVSQADSTESEAEESSSEAEESSSEAEESSESEDSSVPDDELPQEAPKYPPANGKLKYCDFQMFDDPNANYLTAKGNYISDWSTKGWLSATAFYNDTESVTYRGISVGSTAEDVLEAYGETELITLAPEDDLIYLFWLLRDENELAECIKNSAGFYEYSGYSPLAYIRPMDFTAGLRFYVDENGVVTALCAFTNYYGTLIAAYNEDGYSPIESVAGGNNIYSVKGISLVPTCQLGKSKELVSLDYSQSVPTYHFNEDGTISVTYEAYFAPNEDRGSAFDGARYTEEAPGNVKITLADGSKSLALKWSKVHGTYTLEDPVAGEYPVLLVPAGDRLGYEEPEEVILPVNYDGMSFKVVSSWVPETSCVLDISSFSGESDAYPIFTFDNGKVKAEWFNEDGTPADEYDHVRTVFETNDVGYEFVKLGDGYKVIFTNLPYEDEFRYFDYLDCWLLREGGYGYTILIPIEN